MMKLAIRFNPLIRASPRVAKTARLRAAYCFPRAFLSTEHSAPTEDTRLALLNAAIKHVPSHGFTTDSLRTAAAELGYSPSVVGMFSRGAVELVVRCVCSCCDGMLQGTRNRFTQST